MATAPTQVDPANEPVTSRTSREIAAGNGDLANLLTGSDLGVRITGIILSLEEPRLFEGKSQKGNQYSFCQRRIQLFTGNKSVPVNERKDKLADFAPLPIASKVSLKVTGGRVVDGQLAFDVEL